MSIGMDLRVLAKKLENETDELIVKAASKDRATFEKVSQAIAAASTLLEEVASDMDDDTLDFTPEKLDELAAVAKAFDESGDPLLRKQASLLDEILLSIASPRGLIARAKKSREDEINKLRAEMRIKSREAAYEAPKQALDKMNLVKEQSSAVDEQIKRFMPLEAPLQTRYSPDMPGGHMTRITDHIFQDIITGKTFDFRSGYKTIKGNEIPGGDVANQTRELGDHRNIGHAMFETRESIMGRYASDNDDLSLVKNALFSFAQEDASDKKKQIIEFLKSLIEMYRANLYSVDQAKQEIRDRIVPAMSDMSFSEKNEVFAIIKQVQDFFEHESGVQHSIPEPPVEEKTIPESPAEEKTIPEFPMEDELSKDDGEDAVRSALSGEEGGEFYDHLSMSIEDNKLSQIIDAMIHGAEFKVGNRFNLNKSTLSKNILQQLLDLGVVVAEPDGSVRLVTEEEYTAPASSSTSEVIPKEPEKPVVPAARRRGKKMQEVEQMMDEPVAQLNPRDNFDKWGALWASVRDRGGNLEDNDLNQMVVSLFRSQNAVLPNETDETGKAWQNVYDEMAASSVSKGAEVENSLYTTEEL
jgi:hypothetical protein